jgi:anti-sigma factor RsiW
MIPQQWPRTGPLDKLKEIENQQSRRRRPRTRDTRVRPIPRFSRLIVSISVIALALIIMAAIISMVLIFGYH